MLTNNISYITDMKNICSNITSLKIFSSMHKKHSLVKHEDTFNGTEYERIRRHVTWQQGNTFLWTHKNNSW